MIVVEKSIVIARPVEEVFAYVTDFRHSPEWQEGMLEVRKMTDGPLRVGTRFEFVRKLMGRKVDGAVEFVAYKPNSEARWTLIGGPMPGQASYLLESTPEGTNVTNTVELHPSGLSRLAGPFIAASIRRQMSAAQRTLKELLENRAGISS